MCVCVRLTLTNPPPLFHTRTRRLLSHGAMINTVDYYSYTCVDYAREASMQDLAAYLQARLEKCVCVCVCVHLSFPIPSLSPLKLTRSPSNLRPHYYTIDITQVSAQEGECPAMPVLAM